MILRCFLYLLFLLGAQCSLGVEEEYDPFEFLSAYCWDCHDELTTKGDRELVSLELQPGTDILMAERWEEVMHQLQLGEMPPSDKDQPSDQERRQLIRWIEETVEETRSLTKSQGGRVTHRRLNRHEYLITLRDVFALHQGRFDPTQEFPADESVEGFENNGAALRISDQLLQNLFRSADETIDHLYEIAGVGNEGGSIDLEVTLANSGFENSKGFNIRGRQLPEGPVIAISEGMRSHSSTYDAKLFFDPILARGVPRSGWYTIVAEVQAANRQHKYGDKLVWSVVDELYGYGARFFDQNSPIELGIGSQSKLGPQERRKTPPQYHNRIALPDETFTTVERRIWLDAGASPYLTFHNGPPKGVKMQFVTNELWAFDKNVPRIHPKVRANLTERSKRNQLYWDYYQGPEIRVRRMSLRGPLPQEQPHPSTQFLFRNIAPDATSPDRKSVDAEILRIARRLYRAPLKDEEVTLYFDLAAKALDEGATWAEALRPILKAMLCSPRFLFLTEEIRQEEKGGLREHELRNRISYFLTAGPPDSELRTSKISDPVIRKEQVKRLLASDKAERALSLFASQWLGLNRLGTMPPGAAEFPEYYIDHLEPAMKRETQQFRLSFKFAEWIPA